MRQASSVSDFLGDPVGKYFLGRRHCAFVYSPTLHGFSSWGRPDVDDVQEILRVTAVGSRPEALPHGCIVDTRGLEFVEPETFGLFRDYSRNNRDALEKKITRVAQFPPEGIVGAIMAGFSHVVSLPYPYRVFSDVTPAPAWLGLEQDEGIALLVDLARIRDGARATYDVVGRLRAELRASGALAATVAARRLGLSTRGLQRALREAGTTYRMELKAFQITRAQELLLEGERSLAWIAAEVGFSSPQNFATAYGRVVGTSPSVWRTNHRAAG